MTIRAGAKKKNKTINLNGTNTQMTKTNLKQ